MPGTQTYTSTPGPGGVQYDRVLFAWVSDGSGNATVASIAGTNGMRSGVIVGTIYKVETMPGSGGSQPTSGYDVTLTDTPGGDVLAGLGADRSNTAAEYFCPMVRATDGTTDQLAPTVVSDVLTLNVSNAGSGKIGMTVVYLK